MNKGALSYLLADNPGNFKFSVHRDAFVNEDVYNLELENVFEGTWVYLGHECQIPLPNDFFTTHIGRHPVMVTRDAVGEIHGVHNVCRHRGMLLSPERKGNQRVHMCRYHGWAYDSAGKNKLVALEGDGSYPPSFCSKEQNLTAVPKLEIYNGFIFASLSENVPSLRDHLGGAAYFLDLITLQGCHGIEFVPGDIAYTFDANWKLQIENALDMYHFRYVHTSYVELLSAREKENKKIQIPNAEQGSLDFGRGHALMWRTNNRATPEILQRRYEDFKTRMDESQLVWCMRGMNLTIFPNLQLVDNVTSVLLRTIRPLGVNQTEMRTYCVAPRGEDAENREYRIRDYEEFFNPSGLATPDDNVIYEHCQSGLESIKGPETSGYLRGMDRSKLIMEPPPGPQSLHDWVSGPRSLGDETCFHGAYREWFRLLSKSTGS